MLIDWTTWSPHSSVVEHTAQYVRSWFNPQQRNNQSHQETGRVGMPVIPKLRTLKQEGF